MIQGIRNFAIVAHVDHGKSTLADRILEMTGTVDSRAMRNQFLDKMDIERERGITIKSQTVTVFHKHDGEEFQLNLIDTPGHVDFTYEVSRALAACEGVVLLVDASQGIEAQTVAHFEHAKNLNLKIIPCLNKCDLPNLDMNDAIISAADYLDVDPDEIMQISAKSGEGVESLLGQIIEKVPCPKSHSEHFRGLVFDSEYDSYRGVIAHIRIIDGFVSKNERLNLLGTNTNLDALEIGYFRESKVPKDKLSSGEVGYIVTNLKNISECRVGDTVSLRKNADIVKPLSGYEPAKQMVFSSFYPVEGKDFEKLRNSVEKLSLNDSSITWDVENSPSFGFGLRMGFLGPLHKEVIQERIEREFDLDIISTAPTVSYKVVTSDGNSHYIKRIKDIPYDKNITEWMEPVVNATISFPDNYLGKVMDLVQKKRGSYVAMENTGSRIFAKYEIPLAEVVNNFFSNLKSSTQGYAGLDYKFSGWRKSDLQVVEINVAGNSVEALGNIIPKDQVYSFSRSLVDKLAKEIPRHQFKVPVQAFSGGRVVAAKTIPPYRKDVIAKCYGGDITRKRKLLEKQKEGKKRLKQVGTVAIPQSALLSILDL